jgi:hypothetical protein
VSPSGFFSEHYEAYPPFYSTETNVWTQDLYVVIPAYTEGGLWRVVNMTTLDTLGNSITYVDDDDFAAVGVNNSVLFVTSIPDYLPPQLHSIAFLQTSKVLTISSFGD